MLDTNILIYLIKNQPPAVAERVRALDAEDQLCMSFVTYAELLKGACGSQHREAVLTVLDKLVREVTVRHDTSDALCVNYAEQSVRLKAAGTPIGGNDLWIACHALAEKATLVTNNLHEFQRIDGLTVENWV